MDLDYQLITDLRRKAEVAESHINHIKLVSKNGDFPDGLDIPSVNELRYALHHLLRYLTGEASGAQDALKHVHRAIFDCFETESLYLFSLFSDFESGNQDILMKDVFPKYLDWAREFSHLRDFIKVTPRESRQDYYAQLEDMLKRVRPFIAEVSGVRQEILKIRVQKEAERAEKDQALKLATENLALARQTVKIRTAMMVIAVLLGLGGILVTALYRF